MFLLSRAEVNINIYWPKKCNIDQYESKCLIIGRYRNYFVYEKVRLHRKCCINSIRKLIYFFGGAGGVRHNFHIYILDNGCATSQKSYWPWMRSIPRFVTGLDIIIFFFGQNILGHTNLCLLFIFEYIFSRL